MVSRQRTAERLRDYFSKQTFPLGELARIQKKSGITKGTFQNIRSGCEIPRLKTAFKISEAGDLPGLLEIIQEYRTKICENPLCSNHFTDETPSNCRHFCEKSCAERMGQIRKKGIHLTPQRVVVAERRVLMYSKAVEAMCRSCEPEGVCRNIGCPLRSISPLPYLGR